MTNNKTIFYVFLVICIMVGTSMKAYAQSYIYAEPRWEIQENGESKILYHHSARSKDVKAASCITKKAPSVEKMLGWLGSYAGEKRVNKKAHGVEFIGESPRLISLYKKLFSKKKFLFIKDNYIVETPCDKVICAAKNYFGDKLGIQLLYMLGRYGFNGSELSFSDRSRWKTTELDEVLMAIEDLPDHLFPISKNRSMTRFKRGYTLAAYASDGSSCVGANSSIVFFDCWAQSSFWGRREMIIHEVGHYIDEKTISSKVWKKVSGWNKSNKKGSLACTLSYYGTSSKYEDFAESITAYRYAPHLFKDCPEKYELLKEKVFGGIEYKTEAQCKR